MPTTIDRHHDCATHMQLRTVAVKRLAAFGMGHAYPLTVLVAGKSIPKCGCAHRGCIGVPASSRPFTRSAWPVRFEPLPVALRQADDRCCPVRRSADWAGSRRRSASRHGFCHRSDATGQPEPRGRVPARLSHRPGWHSPSRTPCRRSDPAGRSRTCRDRECRSVRRRGRGRRSGCRAP